VKAFFVTAGSVFGLIAIAHIARMVVEPRMAAEPWFLVLTVIAAALSVWSWRLFWTLRGSKGS
jgi:hypothetical protein